MNNTTVPDNIMPDDMQNMQMANGVLSKKSPAPDSHTHKKKTHTGYDMANTASYVFPEMLIFK